MYAAGVRALVEPAFWLGQPRTSRRLASPTTSTRCSAGSRSGPRSTASATTARSPSTPRRPTTRAAAAVLDVLPRYLVKDGVVAVGEIGYDSMTPSEDEAFAAQLAAGRRARPARAGAHPAPRQARAALRRTLDVVRGVRHRAPDRVVVDHLNEVTVGRSRTAAAGWASPSTPTPRWTTRPDGRRSCSEYGPERILVNSAADWGKSDPLRPARPATRCSPPGFTEDDVDQVLWRNPVAFYGQSAAGSTWRPAPDAERDASRATPSCAEAMS